VKRLVLLLVLAFAVVDTAHAQQATVLTGFLGAEFFDTDAPLETSPVLGLRWAWFARNGHGFETTLDYTESRVEVSQLGSLLGLSFDDPQTIPEQHLRIALDYAYVGRGGLVRPYVTAGVGYLDAELVLSNRAERILANLNREVETQDSSITYEAGAGVLVGEERMRFRYDMRIIRIDDLFIYGGTTTYETSGGISLVF
jgi:opacity protein-like surface antigen